MASISMKFPGGRDKALTLSYDDGTEPDIRLVEIMKKNGLKGTFNLSSALYPPEGTVYPEGKIHRMTKKRAQELFMNSGMEVAVHGYTHPWLEQLPVNVCTMEVLRDRAEMEDDYDCIVRGMAYPFGTYDDEVVEVLKRCGIAYARTTVSTEKFDIPTDWLRMPTTCHHNNPRLMELAQEFVNNTWKKPVLFYLWGHSFEFEGKDNWHVIEEFAEYMGNREEIWYATNIEIYDYIKAYEQLQFSVNGEKVYNPTNTELCFARGKNVYCVKPGEIVLCN